MKELLNLQGGYPREMDYLLNLQQELLTLGNGLFSALNMDLILSGCSVTNNGNGTVNIAAGLVYIAGEALRFDGANNILSDNTKAFAKAAYSTTDSKLFADGSNKNVYREAKAVISNAAGSISEIKVSTRLYDLKQFIQDQVNASEPIGTIKELYDLNGTFLTNFDSSGVGVTARWIGWVLDNGNAGTPGSVGRVLVGAGRYTDPDNGEQTDYAAGTPGGHRKHKQTSVEAASQDGLINELDGPHHKPGDGGGDLLYYVRSKKAAADAAAAMSLEQQFMAVYRVVKVA